MTTKKILSLVFAALLIFTLASCGGKGKDFSAELTKITDSPDFQTMCEDTEYFETKFAPAAGMDSEAIKSFEAGNTWKFYTLNVKVTNKTKNSFNITEITAEGLKDDIYILPSSVDGQFCSNAGSEDTLGFVFLTDGSVNGANNILKAMSDADLSLKYYKGTADDDEPEGKKIMSLPITMGIPSLSDTEKGGKKNKNKAEAEITVDEIEDGEEFLEAMRANDIAFSNESKLFGLDSETAPKVIAKDSKWECYVLNFKVSNKTDHDLTFYTVSPSANGKDGVWINSVSQFGEYSIAGGTDDIMPVTVLFNPEAANGKAVENVLEDLDFSFTYSKTPEYDENGQESMEEMKIVEVSH